MCELIFICSKDGYELYNILNRYFEVEILDNDNNEMGVLDALRVLVEPISKTIETLGNIISALINKNSCTISVKNGEKEVFFNGQIKNISNEEIMELISKVIKE